jgi:hypothetical protein
MAALRWSARGTTSPKHQHKTCWVEIALTLHKRRAGRKRREKGNFQSNSQLVVAPTLESIQQIPEPEGGRRSLLLLPASAFLQNESFDPNHLLCERPVTCALFSPSAGARPVGPVFGQSWRSVTQRGRLIFCFCVFWCVRVRQTSTMQHLSPLAGIGR